MDIVYIGVLVIGRGTRPSARSRDPVLWLIISFDLLRTSLWSMISHPWYLFPLLLLILSFPSLSVGFWTGSFVPSLIATSVPALLVPASQAGIENSQSTLNRTKQAPLAWGTFYNLKVQRRPIQFYTKNQTPAAGIWYWSPASNYETRYFSLKSILPRVTKLKSGIV